MMGRLDWGRPGFAMHRQTYASSQTKEIMAKYRPIAPKPTLHIAPHSICKSTCNPNSVLDCSSAFSTTHKGNSNAKSGNGGHNRSGHRRRASDCSNSPSPRRLKRAKVGIESITHNIVGTSVPAPDGPRIVCNFQASFSAEKSNFEKPELEAMERTPAVNAFKTRGLLDKKHAGFEGLNAKEVIESIGEVGTVRNPVKNTEVMPVAKMSDTQCGCGFASYFVFPIVSGIQQEEEKNLVTLPLLPETPDSVLGSGASNSASTDHKPNICKCHKEEIPFRLFGRDFSYKEVGACQISSNESPKHRDFVPMVGLSFL